MSCDIATGAVKRIGKETLRSFAGTGLFLLATAFLTENMGSMSHALSDLTGLCLLLAFALSYLPINATPIEKDCSDSKEKTKSTIRKRLRADKYWPLLSLSLLYIATAAMVLTWREGVFGLAGLAIFLFGFDLILKKVGHVRPELPTLLMTTLFYGLFLVLLEYVPWAWSAFQGFSLAFSSAVGWIINRHVQLAATYSGLQVTVLFAFYFLAAFLLSGRKRVSTFIGVLASLLAANAVYIILWSLLANSSFPRRLDLAQPFISSLDFKPLLFLLLLVPMFFLMRSITAKGVPAKAAGRNAPRLIAAVVLLTLSVVLLALWLPGSKKGKDVVFYDNHYLDWSVPNFNQLSLERIGMFGLLPAYLEAKGYTTRTKGELTPESLGNTRILVVINLDKSFDPKTRRVIWDFVDRGGSLLVLGDHTGKEAIRKPFNNLLRPVNIEFNFDSAISIPKRWENGYELRSHPLLAGIPEDELQIGTGASLSVSYPSRPVILGRYGFSDKGNPLDRRGGYLGDMKFVEGERLGDIVLAAEAFRGKGKVLAFGDTSPFQNGAIKYSYRFVDDVFAWLAASGGKGIYPNGIFLALALLAVSLGLLFSKGVPGAQPLLVCTLVLALALAVSQAVSTRRLKDYGNLSADVANIDISHLERVSLDPFSSESIDGFAANLSRNGYIPLLMRDFAPERMNGGKLLAIIAPAKPFSSTEIESISDFVWRGGLLVVTVGWEESGAAAPLLKRFGMSVGNVPLGRIIPEGEPQGVSLWEAWPVGFRAKDGVQVLVKAWDYPVIVFRKYGKGGVLAAGDSYFLLNKNLEGVYSYNEGNILFIKGCLERIKQGSIRNQ